MSAFYFSEGDVLTDRTHGHSFHRLAALCFVAASSCSSEGETSDDGANGGVANGGGSGDVSAGAAGSSGTATTGGASTGGAATGGTAVGGAATGGAATGGAAGATTGGTAGSGMGGSSVDGAGSGDGYVSNVAVAVHAQVRTVLVVTWNQVTAADTVHLEFTFENGEILRSRAKPGAAGIKRDVTLGVPASTLVTIHIVSTVGGTSHATRAYMGTTGALPAGLPVPTVTMYDAHTATAGEHEFQEWQIDRANRRLTLLWSYDAGPEWAMWKGMAIKLANGNVLANYGSGGVIREITQDKATVFHVKFDAPITDDNYNNYVGNNFFVSDLYALNGGGPRP